MLCEQTKMGEDGVLAEYLRGYFLIFNHIEEFGHDQ